MRREQGFSLVELLLVVAIIGIIAGLAVLPLQRARRYVQAGSAIQSLRTITTAQNLYERGHKVYATLAELALQRTIDANIASGAKSGYNFTVTLPIDAKHFSCNGDPQPDPSANDHFFVDDTAIIRYKEGAPADVTCPPIPR